MSDRNDSTEVTEPDLEAHLRLVLDAVAATVTETETDRPGTENVEAVQSYRAWNTNGTKGHGRVRWLAAVAAMLLIAVGGIAAIRDRVVHPAAELASGTWSEMRQSPLSPRLAPNVVWFNTEMMVFGGYAPSGATLVDGAAYNPSTDTWRPIASLPGDPVDLGNTPAYERPQPAAVVGGQILTVFHPAVSDDVGWDWDLVAYTPDTESWTTLDQNRYEQLPTDEIVPTTGAATVHGVTAAVGWRDQLIVFGWRSDLSKFGWARFDPADQTWSRFKPIEGAEDLYSYPPSTGSPALVDDQYFVLFFELGAARPNLGVVIDLESDEGRLIPSPATPPGEPADGATDYNFGIWSGGTTGTAAVGVAIDNHGQAFRTAFTMDPSTGALIQATDPRSGPVDDGPAGMVDVPGGHMIVGGLTMPDGLSRGGLRGESVVMFADEDITRWADGPQPPIDVNRTGHAVLWTGAEVIVWGGATVDAGGPVNLASVPLADGAIFTPGGSGS